MNFDNPDRFGEVKKMAIQVGGKLASVLLMAIALLYLVEPLLPDWLKAFAGRAQFFLFAYMLSVILWRSKRGNEMTAEIGAKVTVGLPGPNSAEDPAISRAIGTELETHPPPSRSGP